MDINTATEKDGRLLKGQKIKAKDGTLYKSKFPVSHSIIQFLLSEKAEQMSGFEYFLAGRVVNLRIQGGIIFFDIIDSTGRAQCVLRKNDGEEIFTHIKETLDLGDFIGVVGVSGKTKAGIYSVFIAQAKILSKSLRTLPDEYYGLQDVEKRYRQRYLDMIGDRELFNRIKARSLLIQSMREWFLGKNFNEVVTRTLQPKAGGTMAKPFVTHHNALDVDMFLRISPELDLKTAICGGFDRVFEFATNFRNEGIDASHLQEFQMLEWYCAYEDYKTGIEWTIEILKKSIPDTIGSTYFNVYDGSGNMHEVNIDAEFETITFTDLMRKYNIDIWTSKEELLKIGEKYGLNRDEFVNRSVGNLIDDIYKKVVRPHLIAPVFIINHPSELYPLARPNDENPLLADNYQLVIGTWEIVKGYSELVDPVLQRQFFENQQKARDYGDEEAMPLDEDFLVAMEHGMPPITGCGIGIDRLLAIITSRTNLKETAMLPMMRPGGSDLI